MRIGVDARFLDRDRRGMGRYVASLVAALRAQGHDVELLTEGAAPVAGRPPTMGDGGLRTEDRGLPWTGDRGLGTVRAIDVCWCPWGRADLTVPGVPTVVTIHDLAPLAAPRRGLLRALDRRHDVRRLEDAVGRADGIVTPSAFTRDELVTRMGVAASRVAIVGEGVAPEFFAPLLPRPDGPLLWVGTGEERKSLARLLDAFARVRQRGFDVQLVLAGDNPTLLTDYRRQLAAIDGRAVVVTGYLTDAELMALYRTARLFVYPSLYEGFGLPVIEAMAAGTPVVCSSAASLPEVAGDAAVYFDPLDVEAMTAAICRCLDDQALCASLAERGRTRAAGFTWEAAARSLATAFERVSQGGRGDRRAQGDQGDQGDCDSREGRV